MKTLEIIQPDDWHWHPRRGEILLKIIQFTAATFGRTLCFGNFSDNPIDDASSMREWRKEILRASAPWPDFMPIMTIMLTKKTTPQIVREAHAEGAIGVKWIPEGTSTGSNLGIALEDMPLLFPVFEVMQELGMFSLNHWELMYNPKTGDLIPEAQREVMAIPHAELLAKTFPELPIVNEHASTRRIIELTLAMSNMHASLTPQHMIITTDQVLNENGRVLNPHLFCKPVAKSPDDRQAVIDAATSGNKKFHYGGDSAAHEKDAKERGAAGVFHAPIAIQMLTGVFEAAGALDKLEGFTSRFGAECFGFPLNQDTITLVKQTTIIPSDYNGIISMFANHAIDWQIAV